MRPYPTIDDQIGGFLDTMLQRHAAHWRPATNKSARASIEGIDHHDPHRLAAVEGEQSEDSPISERAA